MDENAAKLLDGPARERLAVLAQGLGGEELGQGRARGDRAHAQAEAAGVKLGQLAQPLRAALTGAPASPGIFEVMAVLGREEVLARLADAVAGANAAAQRN